VAPGPVGGLFSLAHRSNWLVATHAGSQAFEHGECILGVVSDIFYSRITGSEAWVTSDGRAYFVQLNESQDEIRKGSTDPLDQDADVPLQAVGL
jgi:hypothetical protein